MEEFLAKEAVTGGLRGVLPPGNSSEAWGPKLWSYLNQVRDCVSILLLSFSVFFFFFFVCCVVFPYFVFQFSFFLNERFIVFLISVRSFYVVLFSCLLCFLSFCVILFALCCESFLYSFSDFDLRFNFYLRLAISALNIPISQYPNIPISYLLLLFRLPMRSRNGKDIFSSCPTSPVNFTVF
jgi:hypothetical protein